MLIEYRQRSVSLPTFEADLFGLVEAYKEALWMRLLLENFNIDVNSILIYEDNKSVISTAIGTEDHSTSKHIGFRKNFIQEITSTGSCFPFYIKSEYNIADMLTKPLARVCFIKLTEDIVKDQNYREESIDLGE